MDDILKPNYQHSPYQDGWIEKRHADFDQGNLVEERQGKCSPRGQFERHLRGKQYRQQRNTMRSMDSTVVDRNITLGFHSLGLEEITTSWDREGADHYIQGHWSCCPTILRKTMIWGLHWCYSGSRVSLVNRGEDHITFCGASTTPNLHDILDSRLSLQHWPG